MILKYVIEEDALLVKEYLEKIGLSRNIRKKARVQDIIYINGDKSKNYVLLHKGDILELKFTEKANDNITSVASDLDIKYEDEYLMVINKPKGISSQPSRKHVTDNIISMIKHYFEVNNINSNVHLVNRLDFQTSGLMIIAKDGITHFAFSKIDIKKLYLCEIVGHIEPVSGIIDLPIAREKAPSIKRYVSEEGKRSITKYKVIKKLENKDLVEVLLETGRTHQIRVHFSYLHHPLVGDELYGTKDECLKLHCFSLTFKHPWKNENIEIVDYPSW